MPRIDLDPVETVKSYGSVPTAVFNHPAFAAVAIFRRSGHSVLYGSDVMHQHSMTLRISRSEMHRSHCHDSHMARDELIEVSMTEAQWATLVSSVGQSEGVPCTLQSLGGEPVPQIREIRDVSEVFKTELGKMLRDVTDRLVSLADGIPDASLSKGKATALRAQLASIASCLHSNMGFVADSFVEHMEDVVESAKAEVNAYATTALAGVANVSDQPVRLLGPLTGADQSQPACLRDGPNQKG